MRKKNSDLVNGYSESLSKLLNKNEYDVKISHAIESAKNHDESILSVTIPFEKIDPLAVLEILSIPEECMFYWEQPSDRIAIAAGGSVVKLRSDSNSRFNVISSNIKSWTDRIHEYSGFQHSLAGVHFLGGFSFFDQVKAEPWVPFGASCFVIPEWLFITDGELSLLTINQKISKHHHEQQIKELIETRFTGIFEQIHTLDNQNEENNSQYFNPDFSIIEDDAFEKWVLNVNEAKELISKGVFNKIVLSRCLRLQLSNKIQPTRMVNQLRKEYPACYSFLFKTENSACFVGSSPEKLLSIRSKYILTEGLAGSISRGKTASEDALLEKKLLNSNKDLEEHNYVVDSIKRRLQTFSNEVNLPLKPSIKRFSNVQHLYTPISAWMQDDFDALEILKIMHPTPAVGGAPTDVALQYIPGLELYDRGWYAGSFGWLNSKGRGEFSVSIRSGLIDEKKAYFFAGCGIVEDSDAKAEWEETKLKLIPMLSAIKHG